jgi:hypothetical protein
MQGRSAVDTHAVGTENLDEPEDLAALARQTLAGIKPNILPPEPFAIGFDLGALAGSSRTSRPAPATGKDDSGRLDLRASFAPAAAALSASLRKRSAAPRTTAAAASSPPRPPPQRLPPRPSRVVQPLQLAPQPQSDPSELEDVIAARSFASRAALLSPATQLLAALRRAPAWSWFALGAACSATIAVVLSGTGEAAQASIPVTSAALEARAQTAAPTASPATPLLPAGVIAASTRSALDREPNTHPQRSAPAAVTSTPAVAQPNLELDEPSETASDQDSKTIDALLDQALRDTGRAPLAEPSPAGPKADSGPPQLPPREAVASVMAALRPRIRFCADGRPGIAMAHVTASSDGRVTDVRVSGTPAARLEDARCMERVIRAAQFPRFQQPSFRVSYPFQI